MKAKFNTNHIQIPTISGRRPTPVVEGLAVASILGPLAIIQRELHLTLESHLATTLEDLHTFPRLTLLTIPAILNLTTTVIHLIIHHPTIATITHHLITLVQVLMDLHLCMCIATLHLPHLTIT